MDGNDLQFLFDQRLTQLSEDLVTVYNQISERHLPTLTNLMMTLHGWTADSVEPWHAELLRVTDENYLLDSITKLRALLKLFDDVAASAEASLQTIHDKQPQPPAKETSKP